MGTLSKMRREISAFLSRSDRVVVKLMVKVVYRVVCVMVLLVMEGCHSYAILTSQVEKKTIPLSIFDRLNSL